MASGERVNANSPIITAVWKYDPQHPRHVRTADVSEAIRCAIREAGFDWRPYVLRRYFDVRLMEAEADGLIIRDWRQFWMGHGGDVEATYTVNKALPEQTVEKMREAYLKAANKYLVTAAGGERLDLKTELKRQLLQVAGYEEEKVNRLDLAKVTDEEFQRILREKLLGNIANNGNHQKVIPINEVETYLTQGWEYVAALPTGKAVLKLPN